MFENLFKTGVGNTFASPKGEPYPSVTCTGGPMPDRMMQFFQYEHLPANLQAASKPFCELARHVEATWPQNAERTVTLRKLLEAKDAAVRSLLEAESERKYQQQVEEAARDRHNSRF